MKLQQLDLRVGELWGDRPTVPRAVQRIVRSMVQWGVLSDTNRRGVYRASPRRPVEGNLAALLLEGLLHSQGKDGGLTSEQLLGHPALFPFEMNVRPYELMPRPEFTVFRQGVDTDVVMLKD